MRVCNVNVINRPRAFTLSPFTFVDLPLEVIFVIFLDYSNGSEKPYPS